MADPRRPSPPAARSDPSPSRSDPTSATTPPEPPRPPPLVAVFSVTPSAPGAPEKWPPTLPFTAWERRYRAVVVVTDVVATITVTGIAAALLPGTSDQRVPPLWLATGTALAVLAALPLARAWHQGPLGAGPEEFHRLGRGLVGAAVLVAFIGLLAGVLAVRPCVFVVLPALAAVLFPQRYLLRRLLHRARRRGRCLLPVLAAGDPTTLRDLIERTRQESHVGWRVEAVCTSAPAALARGAVAGVPVVGTLDQLADHVRRGGYRVVAVTADPYWSPDRLRRLAWDLEGTPAEMVVAPVLMEVAGPRLHVSAVLGMPLLRVAAPRLTGGRRVIKEVADRVGAAMLLALLAPLLLVIAAAIRLGDGGPSLYRQRRVGRDGREFTLLKFRTMVVGADRLRPRLRQDNEATGPLFKMRRDPRVTRVGQVLRRYSLDELPQLVNVLAGRMSLVGPRPPLPEETAAYPPDARRRLLVKPGLTGLWQVSGRSDLSWSESVRLDLRYVEDWSLALDLVILWKTLRAVLTGHGAY
ncbi:exopolysaccharide biosynthesis polyprenyl glycosylphosphotransferase [Amycolatopsis arida]|uniref:Exopolysaccharide biosynthesis polyprenyl glycosylphosphotransferase n=1 Tax=Amycolatopsis arida TaxID=587909 RepID=A0A1I5Z711_9PSEU|nr:sugar transferase [Amycolatopsis arida]TDX90191.1 exopolysaccharide biosynthesis polyprenyl glycosylphosphotransferase [Amycolatopsis arida]SFQ52244.1 exopolysaccharide biosynthesis polyprenyl glycosylphosphotransferase [Amycolatopsis arida]